MRTARSARWGINSTTWTLGWISFFTDLSSEIVYPLIPLFLTGVLGADKTLIGLIEGIAETTASLTKLGSGWLADRLGKNKLLVGLGYGMSALARPFLALAASPWHVLALRFADRLGKGVRTAPRDALLLAAAPADHVGRAFGFHRALDTAGAIAGPGAAAILLAAFGGRFAPVFLVASLPGLVSIWLIVSRLREPSRPEPRAVATAHPLPLWRSFDRRFLGYILAMFTLGLANSSNAFLVLRSQDLGVPTALVPAAYMLYNVVYVAISLPAGVLSDRIGRPRLLALGMAMFATVYLGFGLASMAWQAWALFAAYGLFSGLTEGVGRAFVGDLAPPDRRGAAYGLHHFAIGLSALPASLLMGSLWTAYGAEVGFLTAASLALAALGIFAMSVRRTPTSQP